MRPTDLLERSTELARVDALLQSVRAGDGRVLLIEGPAGIGKTRLLGAAGSRAREDGVRVLAAGGAELEVGFGFGVARQLFEGALVAAGAERRRELLDGPAALAGPALGLEGDPTGAGAPQDLRDAVLHGLHWLTVNLAAAGPLLVVVDDVQWADPPSQRFLAYLGRRLAGLAAGVLAAVRPALPGEDRAALGALAADPRTEVLHPAPLSAGGVAALARHALGAEPEEPFVRACHAATGGNPLLAQAVLAELAERGSAPDLHAAESLGSAGLERVGRAVARRLEALPPGATALARAAAVLGDGCRLDAAAALAGLHPDRAATAASALAAADLLVDGVPLRFRHPVVRAAVAESSPAAERAAAHAAAARVLDERGAPPDAVAAHLLAAAPAGDPWVAARLRAAAREARALGLPDLAAERLRRALAEPPPPGDRASVLRELGSAELAAAQPAGLEHLRAALDLIEDPRERAEVGLEVASGCFDRMDGREAAAAARRALADLGDRDRELSLTLEVLRLEATRMDARVEGDALEEISRLAAGLRGDTPAERMVLASAANMASSETAHEHARAAELLMAALDDGPRHLGSPETGVVSNLVRAGRLDAAEAFADRVLAEARRAGHAHRFALMSGMLGWVALERGALVEAEGILRPALDLAAELLTRAGPFAALLALVHAEQGRLDEAEELLARHRLDGPLPEHQVMNPVLYARARVRAAQRRLDEALADALELGRRYERLGLRRALPPWRSLAAVLLAGQGDAARALGLAEEELELALRWGTPQALGLARCGLGLVTEDLGHLEAAVAALEASPARLDLARAQVHLGAALRRAGRRSDARQPLRLGMDGAHACGAAPLAELARDELRATGARPRRPALLGADALTASERRIALLAAAGRTNRAIAQELFITTATVETHLRHAFRKLGVGSRGELGAALRGPVASGSDAEKIRAGS